MIQPDQMRIEKIISHVIFHELANYAEQLKKISEESLS